MHTYICIYEHTHICIGFRVTPDSTQESLLALHSGMTPGGLRELYEMAGIELRSAVCKVNAIPAILLLQLQDKESFKCLQTLFYNYAKNSNISLLFPKLATHGTLCLMRQ